MAKNPNTPVRPSLKMVEFTTGNAKEAIKAAAAGTKTVLLVPVDMIHVMPGFNVRVSDSPTYAAGIEALKRSIIQNGFYNTKPLAAYVAKGPDGTDMIYLTDGHRRLEAAKAAAAGGFEIERLPLILKPPATTAEELAVSLSTENDSIPLTMLEKAIQAKRLISTGLTSEEVASKLDCSIRYVNDLSLLISAPKAVRAMVANGTVSGTEAVKQLRKAGDDAKAAETKLTALATKAEARTKTTSPKVAKVTAKDTENPTRNPSVKMQTVVTRYALTKGQTTLMSEVQPFLNLMADSNWYTLTDRAGEIEATEDMEITVRIKRPKPETELTEPAEPKARKRKGASAPPGELVYDPNEDEGTTEDDDGNGDETAPDLSELGIAEPEGDDDTAGL